MPKLDQIKSKENEESALARRLVERSGLSRNEAFDAVDAYMNAESSVVAETEISTKGLKVFAGKTN